MENVNKRPFKLEEIVSWLLVVILLVFLGMVDYRNEELVNQINDLDRQIIYQDSTIVRMSAQLDRIDTMSRSLTLYDILFN